MEITEKIKLLPSEIQDRINESIAGLRTASRLNDRLAQLNQISDEEWQDAEEADAETGLAITG